MLVKMIRDASYGKPFSADVHPDEVANFKRGGFVIAPIANDKPMPVIEEVANEEAKAEEETAQADLEAEVLTANDDDVQTKVMALNAEGKNTREIAAETGLTWQKVAALIKNSF